MSSTKVFPPDPQGSNSVVSVIEWLLAFMRAHELLCQAAAWIRPPFSGGSLAFEAWTMRFGRLPKLRKG
jgi:hypothetical protein